MTLDRLKDYRGEFDELHGRLRGLEERFNPKKLNLHFGAPRDAQVWPGLWTEIEELAREGLNLVNKHRDYFLGRQAPAALYDDGMFWYDLFLFIGAVSIANEHSKNA